MPKVSSQLYRWAWTLQPPGDGKLPGPEVVQAILRKWGAKQWVFQEEAGGQSGRHHYQGSVKLATKKRKTWLCRNLNGLDATWITVSPMTSETGSFSYCMKQDSRVNGPWADKPIYQGKDLQMMKTPFEWQATVLEQVAQEPDDRTINWVVDPKGNAGKSKLVKFMCFNKLAVRVPMGNATQLRTNAIGKGANRCYLIDLPRARGKDDTLEDVFAAVEEM